MAGLIDDPGRYRNGNIGVINGEALVHMAPPANRVKKLMGDLLSWLAVSDQHPLITSSEFIMNLSLFTHLLMAIAVWGVCGKP